MDLTRSIVNQYIQENEWLQELETLLQEIETNIEKEPDISIESCKSLFESIARNILSRLDPTYSEKLTKNLDPTALLKNAKDRLLERSIENEENLIIRLTSVVQIINDLRNQRGDIAHGRNLPKKVRSSIQLAQAIKSFTDGFASYLLYLYFSIDLTYTEPIRYEDNPDFNDYLDEENPIKGIVKYSKAFFDQDSVAYENELEEFRGDLSSE